jgi:abhydrolase domain-containing protein 17
MTPRQLFITCGNLSQAKALVLALRGRKLIRLFRPVLAACGLAYLGGWLYFWHRGVEAVFERFPASYAATDCSYHIGRHGNRIAYVFLRNPKARLTLLYAHGSATDLGHLIELLDAHRKAGFNILAYDYPGIGQSEGPLSEQGCYDAMADMFEWLRAQNIASDSIVLYGRSIGTGPALHLATRVKTAGLVLVSPFTSALGSSIWTSIYPLDYFRNETKIGHVQTPILIVHGADDANIPASAAIALARKASTPVTLRILPGRGHGDIQDAPEYWRILRRWTAQPEPP